MPDENRGMGIQTLIAILATVITAGQLSIAYYTYQDTKLKNATDARKTLHDERKDDLDANEHIAELLLEKRDLFQTQEERDLGTEIATALPDLGLKQKILQVIQSRSPQPEREKREHEFVDALAPLKKVTIHYQGNADSGKALDAVHALDAKGWIAYAEPDQNARRQRILYFSNQRLEDAEALRDTIVAVFGKPREWLPIESDAGHQNSYFGVWLKQTGS